MTIDDHQMEMFSPVSTRTTRPYDHSVWLSRLSGWLLKHVFGLTVVGELPDIAKFVIIAAPHTSNWDGVLMVMYAIQQRTHLSWLGKQALFRFPLGGFMRWLGGIPVERTAHHNLVSQVVDAFNQRDHVVLVITPEGTRRKTDHWKTGFYYITQGANVPLALGFVDSVRKTVGIGKVMTLSGDIEADFEVFRAFYADKTGIKPGYEGKVALPPPRPNP
jgi:1-acyl-sn-glycerol-3-phosphate acyltransferase